MKEVHPLVQFLYGLADRDDRAALAELRRSFAKPTAALPYVVPYLRRDASLWEEHALTLVAGLFALHPSQGRQSLATALHKLANESDSVALRFRALLDADAEDLDVHLRHAVSLVRSKDEAIDFDDLARAVLSWRRDDKRAQRAWARDFWGRADHETKDGDKETAS